MGYLPSDIEDPVINDKPDRWFSKRRHSVAVAAESDDDDTEDEDPEAIVTSDEMVHAHYLEIKERIEAYGDVYKQINSVHNSAKPEEDEYLEPLGSALDDYLRA